MLRLLASVATQAFATHLANRRLKRSLRYLVRLAITLAAIFLLVAVGIGFAIAALFLGLSKLVGAPLAALFVAGLMLLCAALVALYANASLKRPDSDSKTPQPAEAMESVQQAAGEGLDALETAIRRDPKTAVLLAVAAGLSIGLIKR